MALPRSILNVLGLEKAKTVAFAREHERIGTTTLNCSLGAVLDLSAGGARVQFKDKPEVDVGDIAHVSVGSIAFGLRLRSQIVWLRRCGWKNWQAGIRFLNVDESTARSLVELARFGRVATPSPNNNNNQATPTSTTSTRPAAANGSASAQPPRPPPQITDLYTILNVPTDATETQIHAAFRSLARQLHPDHNTAPDAAARFSDLSKAYKALRDPETRARYDAMRRAS